MNITILNGAKGFPAATMRYAIIAVDRQQSPAVTEHGCFDTYGAAMAFLTTEVSEASADEALVYDNVRGYAVTRVDYLA